MGIREVFATIVDTADKMPDKVGQDGYLYKWDNDLKKYVNSGQRMTALDDPSAVKVFKLAESGTTIPSAPKGVGGSADGFKSLVELKDNVLGTGVTDWHDDPQSVSKDYPVQWCAVYGYRNVPVTAVGQKEVIFEERFTLTSVILYSTFGAFFTTDGTSITIHNPDGSTVVQPIATPAMIQELQRGIEGIKKQVDGLKESYSGSGAPTLERTKYPMNKWFEEFGTDLPSDPAIITNIYQVHLDDTYLDSDSLVAYRFIQKPGTPDGAIASYAWEVVGDSALSKAIADLHKVAGETVKIFATQPTAPYKVGDIWIYDAAKGLSRTCVKSKAEGEAYSATDWLDPYATSVEVNVIRQDLNQAKTDINTAKGNITDLGKAMTDFSGTFGEALKGNIDINAYKQTLPDLQKQLDREQSELSASINRVLLSPYLTDTTLKNNLSLSKAEVLDAGGKLDQLQKQVNTALDDNALTAEEVASIQNLQASYNTAYKLLKERFEACEAFISNQIPASVQVGSRNLFIISNFTLPRYRLLTPNNSQIFPLTTGEDSTGTYLTKTAQQFGVSSTFSTYVTPGKEYNKECYNDIVFTPGITLWESFEVKVSAEMVLWIDDKNKVTVSPEDGWVRLFKKENGGDEFTRMISIFGTFPAANVKVWYRRPMITEGDVRVITYTEAPEDVEARYQKLIAKVDVEFALSNSVTVAPTSGWVTTAPAPQAGKYMWQRTKTTLKDGTTDIKGVTCIAGADGRSIESITEQYYHSTSMTALQGGSWSDTAPTPAEGKWIWTRSVARYTIGDDTITDAICVTGHKGDNGKDALSATIQVQGELALRGNPVKDGKLLLTPEFVQEVRGGINGYVQCKLLIDKGGKDVTANAISKGANPTWHVYKGESSTQIQTGGQTLNVGKEYADGVNDYISCRFDDTRASEW